MSKRKNEKWGQTPNFFFSEKLGVCPHFSKTVMNRNNQRGSVAGWIITIVILIVVAAVAFLMLTKYGKIPAPPFLATQPWMKTFLPPPAPEAPATPVVSVEANLRNQLVLVTGELEAAQGQVESQKQQLDDKDRTIQTKDDQIAKLQDAINLAANHNISNVALVYEAMDPKEASVILTNLGANEAALILGAMRSSKAADVLALIEPTLATQITSLMAGFKANPSAPAAPTAPGGSNPAPGGTPPATTPPGATGPGGASPTVPGRTGPATPGGTA